MRKNFLFEKQEKRALEILAKTSVGVSAIKAIKAPTKCIRCGATLSELESVKYGYCRSCAKREVDTFRERALKKYFFIILVFIGSILAFDLLNKIKNPIMQMVVVGLLFSLFLYLYRKIILNELGKRKKRKIRGSDKVISYIFMDLPILAFLGLMIFFPTISRLLFLGGFCYLIYRDIKNHKNLKDNFESFDRLFMLESRNSELADKTDTIEGQNASENNSLNEQVDSEIKGEIEEELKEEELWII